MGKISEMSGQAIEAYEPADITVYLQDRGLVLKEKSLVAYDSITGKIAAMGIQAEQMMLAGSLVLRSPLRQGAVADYDMAVVLFTYVLRKALGRRLLRKPAVAVCVPQGITNVERRALEDVISRAGAGPLIISDLPAQQLMRSLPQQDISLYRKLKLVIGIEKDNPEHYVTEQLSHTLNYARRTGISQERVAKLLESEEKNQDISDMLDCLS